MHEVITGRCMTMDCLKAFHKPIVGFPIIIIVVKFITGAVVAIGPHRKSKIWTWTWSVLWTVCGEVDATPSEFTAVVVHSDLMHACCR